MRLLHGCLLLLLALACDPGNPPDGEGEGEGEDAGEGEGERAAPIVLMPKLGLGAAELGVVVNVDDPQSVAVGAAYMAARNIPAENLIEVSLPTGVATISHEEFAGARAVRDALPATIQALALTWTQPHTVACLSIGTAFAVADDEARFCSVPCAPTEFVPTFDDDGHTPFTTHGVRPTMMLAAVDVDDAGALIDRGVASDGTAPLGRGFLVNTSDPARTVRAPAFPGIVDEWQDVLDLVVVNADIVADDSDVLFYFTGLASVADVDAHTWVPGAVADHLTSFGGQLPVSGQMSALRWLTAGATASYGTVVEPCNFQTKFPNPAVLLHHYFRGEPIIEAYWKSVAMPGEGLFIGEPLASPWANDEIDFDAASATLTLTTFGLTPGVLYRVTAADAEAGPFDLVQEVTISRHEKTVIRVESANRNVYRLAVAN